MDFREMLYITTVADYQSVTAAAKKLYISQPSLSYIISRVEEDVGVRLFERKNGPFKLTYAGERYVETARKILLMNENMRGELRDMGQGDKGMVHFGIPTERAGYMLPRVLKTFRSQYPAAEVRFQEAKSEELFRLLMRDEIRFFVLPGNRSKRTGAVKTEGIYKERLFLVAGPGAVPEEAVTAGKEVPRVALERLEGLPFILLKEGHAIREKVDQVLEKHGILPEVFMEISSCISAVQLASAGLGITIVPQRALDVLGGAERFCCYQYGEEPDSWDINAIYKKEVYLTQMERCFIELMKKEFGEK